MRKPITTSAIIGHEPIVRYFSTVLDRERLGHAYLLLGAPHLGKRTLAMEVARRLLCDAPGHTGCGTCGSCLQFGHGTHHAMQLVSLQEGAAKVSIEQIRELERFLSLHAFGNSYKVAIVDAADLMSEEAANALLKTLEEPSPRTVLFLLAASRQGIPATILSRCHVLTLNPVNVTTIERWLLDAGTPKKTAHALAYLSGGRPGIAFALAHDETMQEGLAEALRLLGSIAIAPLEERLAACQNFGRANNELDGTPRSRVETLLERWMQLCRDILVTGNATHYGFIFNASALVARLRQAIPSHHHARLMRELVAARDRVRRFHNPQLVLENLVLSFPL